MIKMFVSGEGVIALHAIPNPIQLAMKWALNFECFGGDIQIGSLCVKKIILYFNH